MNDLTPVVAISPLRQRLIDDMNMRRFSRETRRNYVRDIGRFVTFLGRPPDTATQPRTSVRTVFQAAWLDCCWRPHD